MVNPDSVRCSMGTKYGRARLVVLLATTYDDSTKLDRFLDEGDVDVVVKRLKRDLSAKLASWNENITVVEEPKVVAVGNNARAKTKLADNCTLYEVPIPLEKVQATLDQCAEKAEHDIGL